MPDREPRSASCRGSASIVLHFHSNWKMLAFNFDIGMALDYCYKECRLVNLLVIADDEFLVLPTCDKCRLSLFDHYNYLNSDALYFQKSHEVSVKNCGPWRSKNHRLPNAELPVLGRLCTPDCHYDIRPIPVPGITQLYSWYTTFYYEV